MTRVAMVPEICKAIIYLSSENAGRVTGHIMRVDGGKSLTSRGQSDWYGSQYMKGKIIYDERKSYAAYMLLKNKVVLPPQGHGSGTALQNWA